MFLSPLQRNKTGLRLVVPRAVVETLQLRAGQRLLWTQDKPGCFEIRNATSILNAHLKADK